jgi:AcrR family transcriptional regulator
MKPASPKGMIRRDRVLAAAAVLFARWGFDKTSVDDIAREAGISKGAVYLEFPGKEELFRAVLYRELGRHMEDWLRRFEADPGEWSFARMFQHSLAAIQANPLVRALMTRDRRVFGSFLRADGELFAAVISTRTELFEQLQKAGAMREDIPAPVIAYLVSVIGYGLVASDDVVPEESKVPFDEALSGLGLLLDRGLTSSKNRRQGREFIVAMVEKMKARLQAGARS